MHISRTLLITGADTGLGCAVAARLRTSASVITAGIGQEVDIRADLTRPEGRHRLIRDVLERCDGKLDAVVAAAGIGAASPDTVSLNYFGTVETLTSLRAALAAGTSPTVVIVSSSSTLHRGSERLVRACIAGDEERARRAAERLILTRRGSQIYRSSKSALNHWVRRAAVRPEWTGAGITINAVAPGIIATESVLTTWEADAPLLTTALPQPLGAPGPVKDVVELLAWMGSSGSRFMTGQVIYCDGGTDAATRGVRPLRSHLRYSVPQMVSMVRSARGRA